MEIIILLNTAIPFSFYTWGMGLRDKCPSATYKVNDKSSNLKVSDSQMCTFLLPNCCSPETRGLNEFLTLRKSFRASQHCCLHLYTCNGNENHTSRRDWLGFGKLHFFSRKLSIYLFSNALDNIIQYSLVIFKIFSVCCYSLFRSNYCICVPSPLSS